MTTTIRVASAWLRAATITFTYITAAAAVGTGFAFICEAHAATIGGAF